MPLNMNTVGTGTGIGGGNETVLMPDIKTSNMFHRTNDEMSISEFKLGSGLRINEVSTNISLQSPIVIYDNKAWYIIRNSGSKFGYGVGFYEPSPGESTASTYITKTDINIGLNTIYTMEVVDECIWIIGSTSNFASSMNVTYLNVYKYDGKSLTQITNDGDLKKSLLEGINEKTSFYIRVVCSNNGKYPNKIIIVQDHAWSGSSWIYWHFCELTSEGLKILNHAFRGSVYYENNGGDNYLGSYLSKNSILMFDDFYHYWSADWSRYRDGTLYKTSISLNEYQIEISDNHLGTSDSNPSITATVKSSKTLINNKTGTIATSSMYAYPLAQISRRKMLFILSGTTTETMYVLELTNGVMSVKPFTNSDGKYVDFGLNGVHTPDIVLNLFADIPYVVMHRDYSYQNHMEAYAIRTLKLTREVNYRDPFYTVQIYLLAGDTVSCNAGIISYSINGSEHQLSNVKKYKIQSDGEYIFTMNSYDSMHHPEFIVKSSTGSVGNIQFEVDGDDIIGYFQKGMIINGIVCTANGYQVIKNGYKTKRIEIKGV